MGATIPTAAELGASVKSGWQDHVIPAALPYYKDPLVLVEGTGSWATDADGVEYLDFFCGILTTGIGHCHPEVVERVREQLGRLGHVSTLYLNEPQVNAARRLAGIAPGGLRKSFFTNSGTEAVETAIMLARMFTGRDEIIALRYGYSGRSALGTTLTAMSGWNPLGGSVPWVKHALSPYCYRCAYGPPHDDCAERYAKDVEEVILTMTSGKPAAFFAETIQGAGGYIVPPPGYFQRVAEIIRKHGGLFIADEVQTGFGRTGDRWFGIEHWDVEPDIMVMAKTVASGFPVGVTITRDEIAAAWKGKTISTFGGNPICMTAMDATLEVMERENVPERSARLGKQLRAGLERLARQHAWIGDVRGMGMMQALELVEDPTSKEPSPKKAAALLEAAKAERLLIGTGGLFGHVIRIAPQLLMTEAELADGLERLARACVRVA
ncbi:MAG TPA: aspartate aminotransferase family protein [Gemmatimonadales bacterium]|jgi:4-aminobutyrate aminotransferase|nr:aspartate aminotransferase family protein [Gemmatimonadales bacterium]